MGKWVGAASGVGIPAASFFTSLTPPLFQEVSLITTALSGAIVAMAAKRCRKIELKIEVVGRGDGLPDIGQIRNIEAFEYPIPLVVLLKHASAAQHVALR